MGVPGNRNRRRDLKGFFFSLHYFQNTQEVDETLARSKKCDLSCWNLSKFILFLDRKYILVSLEVFFQIYYSFLNGHHKLIPSPNSSYSKFSESSLHVSGQTNCPEVKNEIVYVAIQLQVNIYTQVVYCFCFKYSRHQSVKPIMDSLHYSRNHVAIWDQTFLYVHIP